MKISPLALLSVIGLYPLLANAQTDPTVPTDLQVPKETVEQIKASKPTDEINGEVFYIVRMDDDPVVAYEGGKQGLPATKPAKGEKINPQDGKVVKYRGYLKEKHDSALLQVGVESTKKAHDYSVCFDGFSVKLNKKQAEELLAISGVISVTMDEKVPMDTITTPDFLGLLEPNGPWTLGHKGEDVIIGVIDSGAWPENPSFDDRTASNNNGIEGKLDYNQIPGWHGKCVPGEEFTAANCNQKLIGAQWFGEGFGGQEGIKESFPYEFVSPRAADGHGVHVASTAGGNENVEAQVEGIGLGIASGMAPRARISSYKVCWGVGEGGCFPSDSVAAIDQAVLDGVDVINFSISGSRTNFLDPVEVAFRFAADAGVFVAASAGNSGPDASTVAHPSPWITTVAAGTHDRKNEASVTLGNGSTFTGASIQDSGTEYLDLVYSANVGLAGADPTEVQLCYPGTLDSALVTGKMVLCDRGVIARVDKSRAVAMANGKAMILANTNTNSLNADLHSVPSIHVQNDDGNAIRSYIAATESPTASLSAGIPSKDPLAPQVAAFSSRGPLLASSDLLKPDIMAPGVDILAAVSPVGSGGRDFGFNSGTSMSSPHIAGLAAVVKSAHRDWTPMMIKSALMTSSDDTAATPFEEGSGHVNPTSAIDPGLVYDSGFNDWLRFLCGTEQLTASYCAILKIDPSDLNGPNIAIGALVGSQTIKRTVTNVGPAGTYQVNVDSPPDVDVSVTPETLTLATGQSAVYEVSVTTTAAATLDQYTFGSLTWSDGTHDVRSALVVRPTLFDAPDEVNAVGSSGTITFDVSFGYNGDYTAAPHGLEEPRVTEGTVVDDPANDINTAVGTGVGVTLHLIDVPAGTAYTRFSLFDSYTDGDDDLDLYVVNPSGFFVGVSGSATSEEEVNVMSPMPGLYFVWVHGYQTDGPDSNYKLFDWSVSATPSVGDFPLVVKSSPTSATLGDSGTIDVSWDVSVDSATEARKYLGAISHSDSGGITDLTIVEVEDES